MNRITIKSTLPVEQETPFDRSSLIHWWEQSAVESSKILVIGAGAIGNEVLKNLALLGVGSIFICDMDVISTSNLSRTVLFDKNDVGKYKAAVAAERVKKMNNNPNCKVDYYVGDMIDTLGHGVFRRFDVVLGCLDNLFTRKDANARCNMFKKPYIDAGISELGLSLSVHHFPESSCLACGMSKKDIETEKQIRYGCDEFKRKIVAEKHAATILISTAIVGALQVQEAMKAIHTLKGFGLEVPIQYGKKYYFQGTSNLFLNMDIDKKPDDECLSGHFTIDDEIIETPLSANDTLGKVLDYLEDLLGYECVIDILPKSFVKTAKCIKCGKDITFNKPSFEIFQEDMYCENCQRGINDGYSLSNDSIDLFDRDCGFTDFTLKRLGIPPLHVINVKAKDDFSKVKYVELTGDLEAVMPNIYGNGNAN